MIGQNWSISAWSGWILQNRANVRMFAVVWFELFERKVVNNHLVTFGTKIRVWYDYMIFMMGAFQSSLISTQIFKSRKINKYQFKALCESLPNLNKRDSISPKGTMYRLLTVVCLKSGFQKSGLLRFCEKVLFQKIWTFMFSPNKPCPKYSDLWFDWFLPFFLFLKI